MAIAPSAPFMHSRPVLRKFYDKIVYDPDGTGEGALI